MNNRNNHLVLVSTYATNKKVSRTHVYDLIREGLIATETINSQTYIDWDIYKDFDVLASHNKLTDDMRTMQKQIKVLQNKVMVLNNIVLKSKDLGPSQETPVAGSGR